MDFNAWVSEIIEGALGDPSGPTTLHINPSQVSFQIQPVAHLEHVQCDSKARFYSTSHQCLSVVFWHPAPHTDRMVPIAAYPCLTDDGLFPTAANIRIMVHQVILAIDAEYGNRLAVLEKS
jgi:hypothetical protein